MFTGWKITGVAAIALAVATAVVLLTYGFTEFAVRLLLRDTARVAVTFFLFAFTASALNRMFQAEWTAWLTRNRRYVGVSFALAHVTHLSCLVALYVWFPHPFREYLSPATIYGGGLAYVFLALMTATSFDRTAALLGRRAWTALHTVGSYYIWIIFAQSYIPRAMRDPWYIPFAAALLLGIGLRGYTVVAQHLRKSRSAMQ